MAVGDLADIPFREDRELDALIGQAQQQKASGGKMTTILGHGFDIDAKVPNRENLNILNIDTTGKTYDEIWDLNREWLDTAIDRGDDILLVTENPIPIREEDGEKTYTLLEREHLEEKGYKRVGNYMVKF